MFIESFTQTGNVACNTLIAFTIFLVVVAQLNLGKHNRVIYWLYVTFAIAYPAAV